MRRLRSAWKLFDGWIAPVPDAMLQQARAHFAAFGANRDQDVLNETVAPALARAGMPVIPVESTPPEEDARTIAGGKAFQAWLLDLLEWSLDVPPPAAAPDGHAIANGTPTDAAPEPAIRLEGGVPGALVQPTIIPLQGAEPKRPGCKSSWRGGCAAGTARSPIRACSSLRWTFPRATSCASAASGCYSLAFAESLLPAAKLRGYRKLLSRVQDILGEINDLAVAKEHYEACTATHPQAWFALGWISARLEELATEAQQAFDDRRTASRSG